MAPQPGRVMSIPSSNSEVALVVEQTTTRCDQGQRARDLAEAARLHKEPEEAARFEQIADEAET